MFAWQAGRQAGRQAKEVSIQATHHKPEVLMAVKIVFCHVTIRSITVRY
jgi:hypothetical protein